MSDKNKNDTRPVPSTSTSNTTQQSVPSDTTNPLQPPPVIQFTSPFIDPPGESVGQLFNLSPLVSEVTHPPARRTLFPDQSPLTRDVALNVVDTGNGHFRGIRLPNYDFDFSSLTSHCYGISLDKAVQFLAYLAKALNTTRDELLISLIQFTLWHGTSQLIDPSLFLTLPSSDRGLVTLKWAVFVNLLHVNFSGLTVRKFMSLFADNAREFLVAHPSFVTPIFQNLLARFCVGRRGKQSYFRDLMFDYSTSCSGLTSEQLQFVVCCKNWSLDPVFVQSDQTFAGSLEPKA